MNDQQSETPSKSPRLTRNTSSDSGRPDPARQKRTTRIIWFVVALLLAMVLAVELPNQMVAWRFAEAVAARDAGDKEKSREILAEVRQRRPHEDTYEEKEYFWNKEDGKYEEALAFLQRQLASRPSDTELLVRLLLNRQEVYMHLRRYPEAIEDCLELKRISETTGKPERQDVLNTLAYARALAGVDLDEALKDIELALKDLRGELTDLEQKLQTAKGSRRSTYAENEAVANQEGSLSASLDTRAMILMKTDKLTLAQVDFDESIRLIEKWNTFVHENKDTLSSKLAKKGDYQVLVKKIDQHRAVIYYHRSLNLEKLGREDDAKKDFEKAKELAGKEPDETLF